MVFSLEIRNSSAAAYGSWTGSPISIPPCDTAPYFTAGIPSLCHITGPLYLFDHHDTIDKVRAEDLPRGAGFVDQLICNLDRVPADALEIGLARHRDDPPAPPPPWVLPAEV